MTEVTSESCSCSRDSDSNPKFPPVHGGQGTEGSRAALRAPSACLTRALGGEVGAGREPRIRSETRGGPAFCVAIVPDLNLPLVCTPPRRGSVGVLALGAELKNARSFCRGCRR